MISGKDAAFLVDLSANSFPVILSCAGIHTKTVSPLRNKLRIDAINVFCCYSLCYLEGKLRIENFLVKDNVADL